MDSPLKYPGGKAYLASKYAALAPPHKHRVDAYCGSMRLLLEFDPEGYSEVANDIDGTLQNFWTVLSTPELFTRFYREISLTPFSEQRWIEAFTYLDTHQEVADSNDWLISDEAAVAMAIAYFIRCRQSRCGSGDSFASISRTRTRRGLNEQVSAWLSCVDGLPEVANRLARVLITHRPALKLIDSEDGPETFFILDPPYYPDVVATKKLYRHGMTAEEHVALLTRLSSIRGRFLLCGYNNPVYETYAERFGWHRHDFACPNQMSQEDFRGTKTESVWLNYEVA